MNEIRWGDLQIGDCARVWPLGFWSDSVVIGIESDWDLREDPEVYRGIQFFDYRMGLKHWMLDEKATIGVLVQPPGFDEPFWEFPSGKWAQLVDQDDYALTAEEYAERNRKRRESNRCWRKNDKLHVLAAKRRVRYGIDEP